MRRIAIVVLMVMAGCAGTDGTGDTGSAGASGGASAGAGGQSAAGSSGAGGGVDSGAGGAMAPAPICEDWPDCADPQGINHVTLMVQSPTCARTCGECWGTGPTRLFACKVDGVYCGAPQAHSGGKLADCGCVATTGTAKYDCSAGAPPL